MDSNGWTLLHAATQGGHLGVVKLLLRRGVDVDVLDRTNKTAAELASKNGNTEVSKFLAEYKGNANIRNKIRSTTLDAAEYGADEDGEASLHAAAEEGNVDIVKSLLERGTDVCIRNDHDRTPLNLAAMKGNLEVVRLLIEWGAAEVDSRDKSGWTPLHEASRHGHLEVSRVLVDYGANVNAREHSHYTPMHLSAEQGHLGIAKLLLERGADMHALNVHGQTPYQSSLAFGHREFAGLLREHGAGRARFELILS